MTIEEADKRVREAKERVVEFARSFFAGNNVAASMRVMLSTLEEAEKARAALDKPRLMTPEERVGAVVGNPGLRGCNAPISVMSAVDAVVIDRADILTQAEKLPRHRVLLAICGQDAVSQSAILLSDLRNLIEGK